MDHEPRPLRRLPARRPPAHLSPWNLGGLTLAEFGRRLYDEVWDDELLDRAAALSYYVLSSFFPALLFLTALLGLVPVPKLMEQASDSSDRLLAGRGTEWPRPARLRLPGRSVTVRLEPNQRRCAQWRK